MLRLALGLPGVYAHTSRPADQQRLDGSPSNNGHDGGSYGGSSDHGHGVPLMGHGLEAMAMDLLRFPTWERCLVASYLEPLRLALRSMLREYRASAHLAIEREKAAVAHKSDKLAQPLLKLRSDSLSLLAYHSSALYVTNPSHHITSRHVTLPLPGPSSLRHYWWRL